MLSDIRLLNSLEEFCIMWMAEVIVYIYIYIYIYICLVYVYILNMNFCCRSKERKKYCKMSRSTKRIVFFRIYLFCSYICVCFHLVAFIREHVLLKVLLMGYPMRLELTIVCSLNDFQLIMSFYGGYSSLFLKVCLP